MLTYNPDGGWTNDDPAQGLAFDPGSATAPDSAAAPAETVYAAAAVPAALTNEVAYISGITAAGRAASRSYWTDNGDVAHRWGGNTAGVGATITYSFSGYTATEQATLKECMALWSAECNVTFTEAASGGALTLARGTDGGAETSDRHSAASPATGIATTTSSTLSIDTSTYGFDLSGSFTSVNGYGLSTAVHELGHVLGLGHAGDYNGNATPSTDQYSAYDSRLWSIMSYIQPSDTSARYYSSYPVTGTNWGGALSSTTPMMLDIMGVQELYGKATSGPLSGGQVFGFNCNIASTISSFFDFTVNTNPVITLWDGGTGNTLDLSGYSARSTVNLNPGTFTSVNGLVNNIGIAFNTSVDTAIGGSGDDTFTVNSEADTIRGNGGSDTVVFSGAQSSYTLSRAGNVVTVRTGSIADTLYDVEALQFSDGTVQTSSIACFVHGTRLATPGGEAAVEALQPGDLVLTACGAARPIRWIGRRSYAGRFLRANPGVQPVRFRAGSLGEGLPRRDLLVSPQHAMFLDGVLVPARCLVNGSTVTQERGLERADYVHVELDSHDVLLAEGAPSESFLDDNSRGMFQNAAEFEALYPGAARPDGFCAPRVEHGAALEAVRQRLALVKGAMAA